MRNESKPHHHEYPLGKGDTFFAFGEWYRIRGMVALGMPVREITLHVESLEAALAADPQPAEAGEPEPSN